MKTKTLVTLDVDIRDVEHRERVLAKSAKIEDVKAAVAAAFWMDKDDGTWEDDTQCWFGPGQNNSAVIFEIKPITAAEIRTLKKFGAL